MNMNAESGNRKPGQAEPVKSAQAPLPASPSPADDPGAPEVNPDVKSSGRYVVTRRGLWSESVIIRAGSAEEAIDIAERLVPDEDWGNREPGLYGLHGMQSSLAVKPSDQMGAWNEFTYTGDCPVCQSVGQSVTYRSMLPHGTVCAAHPRHLLTECPHAHGSFEH